MILPAGTYRGCYGCGQLVPEKEAHEFEKGKLGHKPAKIFDRELGQYVYYPECLVKQLKKGITPVWISKTKATSKVKND